MKLYLFPLQENDLQYFTELFCAVPYMSAEVYKKVVFHTGFWNEGLFSKLFLNLPPHNLTYDIEMADVVVIPFKYNKNDKRICEYCSFAEKYNKQVVIFYNDDSSEVFESTPKNLIIFRTSAYASKLKQNERIMPAIVPDHMPRDFQSINNKSISFCGFVESIRAPIISKIESLYNNTNFIKRSSFYASDICKSKAKREFYANLLNSTYSLCIRGNGNFSYRFYEALSFGKIPVLFETDCNLPFNKLIDWKKHIIQINDNNINELPKLIDTCEINPMNNRQLWKKFFSAEGYFNNFYKDI